MIKNDFNDYVALLGIKKALAQINLDDVFDHRMNLIEYERFCYNEEGFEKKFKLTQDEISKLDDEDLLYENDLNKLEEIFEDKYPFLI